VALSAKDVLMACQRPYLSPVFLMFLEIGSKLSSVGIEGCQYNEARSNVEVGLSMGAGPCGLPVGLPVGIPANTLTCRSRLPVATGL